MLRLQGYADIKQHAQVNGGKCAELGWFAHVQEDQTARKTGRKERRQSAYCLTLWPYPIFGAVSSPSSKWANMMAWHDQRSNISVFMWPKKNATGKELSNTVGRIILRDQASKALNICTIRCNSASSTWRPWHFRGCFPKGRKWSNSWKRFVL